MARLGLALSLTLSVVAAACTSAAPVASPQPSASTGTQAVQITDATNGELQSVLQAQRDALIKRDLKAYQATFDLERAAFRRCQQDSFDLAGRQSANPQAPQIVRIEPYLTTYVRAWMDEGSATGVRRTYFRRSEGKWIQTEPTSDEIGAEKKTQVGGVDIEYWGIDDDVIESLTKAVSAARDTVAQNQLGETKQLFGIRFYPTRAAATLVDCFNVGFQLLGDRFLRIFRYWFTSDTKAVSQPSVQFITHEALHWAQDDFIRGIAARADWWLIEGWPDHIGQNTSPADKRRAVCSTEIPSYEKLADAKRVFDREQSPVEEQLRYYAFANIMVEYIYAQFGVKAYKDLLLAYKDLVDANKNLVAVLKMSPTEFQTAWIAFAKKKYC